MVFLYSLSSLLPILLVITLRTTADDVGPQTSSDWIATSSPSELFLANGNGHGDKGAVKCSTEKTLKRRGRLNNRQDNPESTCTWPAPLENPNVPTPGTENTQTPAGQQNLHSKPGKISRPQREQSSAPQNSINGSTAPILSQIHVEKFLVILNMSFLSATRSFKEE